MPKNATVLICYGCYGLVQLKVKILCLDPWISCYDSGWFSALRFVWPALEVLAEIKTTIFDTAFSPLIYQQELSHNAI